MNKDNIRHCNYIEYYLPYMVLFAQYKIGIITIAELCLIFLAFLYSTKSNFILNLKKNNWLIFLIVYVIGKNIMNCLIHIDDFKFVLNSTIQWCTMFISIWILTNKKFNEDILYSSWKRAALFFSVGLLYQVISIFFLGRYVAPISLIPGYDIRVEELSMRPSSFFSEPASFVAAILPLLFMALRRFDYKWAFATTLMIFITTSTVGIVLASVLWLVEIMRNGKNSKTKFVYLMYFAIGIITVNNSTVFELGINKLLSVLEGGSTVGARIVCGFDTISTLGIIEWLFGSSYNNVSDYILDNIYLFSDSSPVYIYMNAHGSIFLNTFCQIIFHYGLIGFVLYWMGIYSRLFNKDYKAKAYLIMMLISIIGQSKLFNVFFFMDLILVLLYDNKSKETE